MKKNVSKMKSTLQNILHQNWNRQLWKSNFEQTWHFGLTKFFKMTISAHLKCLKWRFLQFWKPVKVKIQIFDSQNLNYLDLGHIWEFLSCFMISLGLLQVTFFQFTPQWFVAHQGGKWNPRTNTFSKKKKAIKEVNDHQGVWEK